MSIKDNIQELRKRHGITQHDLAHIAGVTNKAVSSWEGGLSEPRMGALEKMASHFGLQKSNLIEKDGLNKWFVEKTSVVAENRAFYAASKDIPLIGTICAGDGLLAESNIEEYISYPFQSKRQPDYALRVKGDSMEGVGINEGDIVYMRDAQWAEHNGQIVAAIVNEGEEGMLKRMRWTEGSPVVRLVPENDSYETLELLPNQIQVCGVYMGHFSPERG